MPSDLWYWLRLLRPGAVAARRDVVGALHARQAPNDRHAAPGNGIGRDNRLRQGDPPLIAARIRAGHQSPESLNSSDHLRARTLPFRAAGKHVRRVTHAGTDRAPALDAVADRTGRAEWRVPATNRVAVDRESASNRDPARFRSSFLIRHFASSLGGGPQCRGGISDPEKPQQGLTDL